MLKAYFDCNVCGRKEEFFIRERGDNEDRHVYMREVQRKARDVHKLASLGCPATGMGVGLEHTDVFGRRPHKSNVPPEIEMWLRGEFKDKLMADDYHARLSLHVFTIAIQEGMTAVKAMQMAIASAGCSVAGLADVPSPPAELLAGTFTVEVVRT